MLNKQQIQHLALQAGFKLKKQPDGSMDLNPYVYEKVSVSKLKQMISNSAKITHWRLCPLPPKE